MCHYCGFCAKGFYGTPTARERKGTVAQCGSRANALPDGRASRARAVRLHARHNRKGIREQQRISPRSEPPSRPTAARLSQGSGFKEASLKRQSTRVRSANAESIRRSRVVPRRGGAPRLGPTPVRRSLAASRPELPSLWEPLAATLPSAPVLPSAPMLPSARRFAACTAGCSPAGGLSGPPVPPAACGAAERAGWGRRSQAVPSRNVLLHFCSLRPFSGL